MLVNLHLFGSLTSWHELVWSGVWVYVDQMELHAYKSE